MGSPLSDLYLKQEPFFDATTPFYDNAANFAYIQNNLANNDGSGVSTFDIQTTDGNIPYYYASSENPEYEVNIKYKTSASGISWDSTRSIAEICGRTDTTMGEHVDGGIFFGSAP